MPAQAPFMQQPMGGFSNPGVRRPNYRGRGAPYVNNRGGSRNINNGNGHTSSHPNSVDNRSGSARSGSEVAPNIDGAEDLASSMTEMKVRDVFFSTRSKTWARSIWLDIPHSLDSISRSRSFSASLVVHWTVTVCSCQAIVCCYVSLSSK